MEQILQWDYASFTAINHLMLPQFLDQLLIFWRTPLFWAPLYLLIITLCVFNFGSRSWLIILYSLLVFGFADIMSSHIIKKNVQRIRPCRSEYVEVVNVRVYCGSGYSFTSSHAANHCALAVFWFMILGPHFKFLRYPILIWAAIVGFAQIYVGVHFPLDVLFGTILGSAIGFVGFKMVTKYLPSFTSH